MPHLHLIQAEVCSDDSPTRGGLESCLPMRMLISVSSAKVGVIYCLSTFNGDVPLLVLQVSVNVTRQTDMRVMLRWLSPRVSCTAREVCIPGLHVYVCIAETKSTESGRSDRKRGSRTAAG